MVIVSPFLISAKSVLSNASTEEYFTGSFVLTFELEGLQPVKDKEAQSTKTNSPAKVLPDSFSARHKQQFFFI
jgi:hypothetical protein